VASAQDIIFDPNILTVATEWRSTTINAVNFMRPRGASRPPAALQSERRRSNISFSFPAKSRAQAMHSAFLYHAIKAGMDMAS